VRWAKEKPSRSSGQGGSIVEKKRGRKKAATNCSVKKDRRAKIVWGLLPKMDAGRRLALALVATTIIRGRGRGATSLTQAQLQKFISRQDRASPVRKVALKSLPRTWGKEERTPMTSVAREDLVWYHPKSKKKNWVGRVRTVVAGSARSKKPVHSERKGQGEKGRTEAIKTRRRGLESAPRRCHRQAFYSGQLHKKWGRAMSGERAKTPPDPHERFPGRERGSRRKRIRITTA